MKSIRYILALILSVSLVLSTATGGHMRGSLAGLETLTICSGYGTKTITVDQDGNPVDTQHACFDCCLVAFEAIQEPSVSRPAQLVFSADVPSDVNISDFQHFTPYKDARAPPSLI